MMMPLTLPKEERLCSKKLIEQLFASAKSHSATAFPLRAVALPAEGVVEGVAVQVMVSVPKRHFKRAVHRNRIKRQVREAYRKNKHLVVQPMESRHPGETLCMAFVWIDAKEHSTEWVERKVVQLLTRIGEKL